MKKIIIIIFTCIFLIRPGLPAFTEKKSGIISITSIPATLEAFIAMRNRYAKTPQGGAAMLITAMIIHKKDKQLGMQCFTITLDRANLNTFKNIYKGWQPDVRYARYINKIETYPFLGNIYIQKTGYKTDYNLPAFPLQIRYTNIRPPLSVDSRIKKAHQDKVVFIASTGGNTPRPVQMRRNDKGFWKAYEASSLFIGPRFLPLKKKKDDL